ncbi:MAG: glycosyltransferase family 4 protein [Candidatus Cloacimonetes bacterium]|nr:glycosyltransferase family 4 protein [Candidatus Cloacimonadota bacterium]MBS3766821.1 glycosyltransferase family 4 protein [Candidatus Cloacimonadota bacterium]
MNILYISNKKKWGGITSWMQKTAIGLQKKGHKIWVLSHKKSSFTKHASNKINIIPKNLGMDFNPITIIWLVIFILKYKIDFVVTNITKEVIIGGIVAKITRIPNIRRIGNEKDFDHPLMKLFYNLIDYTIVPSNYVKNKILSKHSFLEKDKIFRIYNGVSSEIFSLAEVKELKRRYKIPLTNIVIGYTGKFSRVKNIPALLDVFSDLKNNFKIHLILAGDGPEKDIIINKIKELGIEEEVSLLGFVTNPKKISAMYDIGILFSDIEGFSNSVVEYMSTATPVICTKVGGQKEIIKDGENGFLITARDKERLYEKLRLLIIDPNRRITMGKNARKTVKEKFYATKMSDKVEKIFEMVK